MRLFATVGTLVTLLAGPACTGVASAQPPCPPGRTCVRRPPPEAPCTPGRTCAQTAPEPSRCPAGRRCAAPAEGRLAVEVEGEVTAPRSRVVIVEQSSLEGGTPTPAPRPPPAGPARPAPGALHLGHYGSWDGRVVLLGALGRFVAHLADDLFMLEVAIGGVGAVDAEDYEIPILLGLRLHAPVATPLLRLYGSLSSGVLLRGGPERRGEANVFGIWPLQLGGGVEVGGPIGERWSVGAYAEIRGELRVPFERLDPSVGLAWSAGFAMLWF